MKKKDNMIFVGGRWVEFIPYRQYRTPKGGYYQGMKSKAYWKRRSKELLSETFDSAEEVLNAEQRIYERCLRNVVREYRNLIKPFVGLEFDVAGFTKAKATDIEFFMKEQHLVNTIDNICAEMPKRQNKEIQGLLEKVYVENGKKIANDFNKVYVYDKNVVKTAVNTPWTADGREFSDRIWQHTEELHKELRSTLAEAVMKGEAPDKTIAKFKQRFGNSYFNTKRIVLTETAAIQHRSTIDNYKKLGVEYIENIGSSTDNQCSPWIGKRVRIDEATVGVNCPVWHPFCKCSIIPVID